MQLDAANIGFRYGKGPWLFREVNLSIKPGEIVGLKGPSGTGKTTLCRILAGYERPLEGKVTTGGAELPKTGYHPVQLVFQHPEKAVNPRWKMEKMLEEGGRPDDEILALLGIEQEWLTRWPNELSGGELQRFCVARALGPGTRFLIADEMTTMLDAITQAQIWHAVLHLAEKRKMGILVVSHEAELMKRLCHRVIELKPS
jgi:peptide/nickel transport system ATP-binding protein